MNCRILPPDEWHKLEASGLPALLPYVRQANASVVAVEGEAGELLACVGVLQATHFEGLWIKPEERGNAGVFRALIRTAFAIPQQRGESWAFAGAADGDHRMAGLLRRLGGRELPLEFLVVPVGGN